MPGQARPRGCLPWRLNGRHNPQLAGAATAAMDNTGLKWLAFAILFLEAYLGAGMDGL